MIALVLAALLQFSADDAAFALKSAHSFVETCTPREAGTIRGGIAANWILDQASMTGADIRRVPFTAVTPKGTRQMVNLYAEFKGNPTNRWVVLVSHFDTKPGVECPGANDGASTSALLISVANILANCRELNGNVLLVWTDGEECFGPNYTESDGLYGSKQAVEYLKRKEIPVQAVLCLDMLGDRDLHISIPANGTPALAKIVQLAAKRMGEPKLVSDWAESVKDDHVPFLEAGYKAIDLIDFEYGPDNAWWHTREDTVDKLSQESLERSGKLVCELLNILL